MRPKQNGRHFEDDIFKYIYFYENSCIVAVKNEDVHGNVQCGAVKKRSFFSKIVTK